MRNTVRGSLVLVTLVAIVLALLTGATILPDPCFAGEDDCCSELEASHTCGTLCCLGFMAAPENLFVLETASNYEISSPVPSGEPLIVASEPLIRPPIHA
jgi:hypothetical protein